MVCCAPPPLCIHVAGTRANIVAPCKTRNRFSGSALFLTIITQFLTARGTPFRIEYPIQKSVACQILMGHPLVLKAIERLLGTTSYIPTWDSFVFKVWILLSPH